MRSHRLSLGFLLLTSLLAGLILSLALLPTRAQGGQAPLCDVTCEPNPSSPTYGATIQARSLPHNVRGRSVSLYPPASVASSEAEPLPGSESYNYAVPILSLPGRNGFDLNLVLFYNSRVWTIDKSSNTATFNADRDFPGYGFRLGFSYIEGPFPNQFFTNSYLLTEPDGGKRELKFKTGNIYESSDSSYIDYDSSTRILRRKDGTKWEYQQVGTSTFFRPIKIRDTNGNYISITYRSDYDSDPNLKASLKAQTINTITDTVERVITFNYDAGVKGKLISITQGSRTHGTFIWGQVNLNHNFVPTVQDSPQTGTLINVITGCRYADQTGYDFVYGDWGIAREIRQVSSSGAIRSSISYNYPTAATSLSDHPAFTQQTVNDGQQSSIWTYGVEKTGGVAGLVSAFEITDHFNTKTRANLFTSGWQTGLVSSVEIKNAGGTTLRTITNTWAQQSAQANNPRITSVTTTFNDSGGQQSKVEFTYFGVAGNNGNVTEVREYDFGLVLRRKTQIDYADTNLPNNHILDRPTQVRVYDGSAIKSRTDFAYDSTAIQSFNPNAPQWQDPGSAPRGNLTAITRYSSAGGGSGAITRTFTYDEVGNLRTAQLDCCQQRQWVFTSSMKYAYPTTITTGPSGTQLSVNRTYDLATGLVLTATDENGKVTTFTYQFQIAGEPATNRLRKVTRPDTVVLETIYDDASAQPKVTSKTPVDPTNTLVQVVTTDGLGRPVRQETQSGSEMVYSVVETLYDELGRPTHVTNPCSSAPCPPASSPSTVYVYDDLGRITSVTPPGGGGSYTYDYTPVGGSSGTATTVTDPAGKQRRTVTDALGRLIEVHEPGLTGATSGSGSITISGSHQSVIEDPCNCPPPEPGQPFCDPCPMTIYDSGAVNVTVDDFTASATFGPGATTADAIASTLRFILNTNSASPVTATGSGTSIILNAKQKGAHTNYALSVTWTWDSARFAGPSFTGSPSGPTMVGGSEAPTGGSAPTPGTGLVGISGSIQSTTGSGTPGTGWVDINGFLQSETFDPCDDGRIPPSPCPETIYDSGNVWITVNGAQKTVSYGQGSTNNSVATALRNAINGDGSYPVTAGGTGNRVNLTAKTNGSGTNYSLSGGSSTNQPALFPGPSFTTAPSGATLTGGSDGGTTWDAGNVWITVNGLQKLVSYGQSSTASSVATALRNAINADSNYPVTAGGSGATVTLTAKQAGSVTNYPLSAGSVSTAGFAQPSFTTSPSGSALTGGSDGSSGTPTLTNPQITVHKYDVLDNLVKVVQGAQTRTFAYDSMSRLTSAATPEAGTVGYSYTAWSQVFQRTDARGVVTTYSYDGLNRLWQAAYTTSGTTAVATPTVTFAYGTSSSSNNKGRLTSMAVAGGPSESYTYDQLGRITQVSKVIDSVSYPIGYQYNHAGELTSITYPSGRVVTQAYDAIGRLNQVNSGGTGFISNVAYNAAHQPESFNYGNGVVADPSYNSRLQLSSLKYTKGATKLLELAYNYTSPTHAGNNGQITRIQDTTGTQAAGRTVDYTYDPLGRLQTAVTQGSTSYPKWGLSWDYDRYGNRKNQNVTHGTAPGPQLPIDPFTNRLSGYSYDASGNLLNDGVNTYNYDAENRMIQSPPGSPFPSIVNTYDGAGLRVKKSGFTIPTTRYIFSGTKVVAEYSNGALSKEYIYAGPQLVATITGGTPTYHHPDHLSVRVNSDSSGTIVGQQGHYPFGESWYSQSTTTKWQFTSYERDPESGLDYAVFRYHNSRLGRFMTPDPLAGSIRNPQSLNRYAYVSNDPINFVDPHGLQGCELWCLFYIHPDGREENTGLCWIEGGPACIAPFLDGGGFGPLPGTPPIPDVIPTIPGTQGQGFPKPPPVDESVCKTKEGNRAVAKALAGYGIGRFGLSDFVVPSSERYPNEGNVVAIQWTDWEAVREHLRQQGFYPWAGTERWPDSPSFNPKSGSVDWDRYPPWDPRHLIRDVADPPSPCEITRRLWS